MPIPSVFWIYLLCISGLSVILTVFDKVSAKTAPQHRVPEKTLLLFGFIGGATAMYITMQIIRHKTKHLKFMISLPLMIVLHGVLIFLVWKGILL